jgi:outer membrane protein assembly factor BamB
MTLVSGKIPTFIAVFIVLTSFAQAEDWPQFRGPGGRAASESADPPVKFHSQDTSSWKVSVPIGNSSPIVAGDRIFITGVRGALLETLCLDRKDGHVLWRKSASTGAEDKASENGSAWKLTNRDDVGRPATPTPATDGESVFVFFGPFGLLAYDLDGNERWRQPLVIPDVEAATSPILIDDKLILVCDRDTGSFIEARDKRTGKLLWRIERPEFSRSRATPLHWVHPKRAELVVPGSYWLTSYDPATGAENWRLAGTPRVATGSPAASDGFVFAAGTDSGNDFNPGPEPDSASEADAGFPSFSVLDEPARPKPKAGEGVFAVSSCGKGDITATHLAWKIGRAIPYASSPLVYQGRLFTVKVGGLVSAYDVATGKSIYQNERIPAEGDYYASPVAAAGRVYFASQNGVITAIAASASKPEPLGELKLGEHILATPALAGKTLLVRTANRLHSYTAMR